MYKEFKVLWFSDVHATGKSPKSRIDVYPNTIKEKLAEIGQIANNENVNLIVCGGDLFHTPIVALNYGGEIAKIIKSWNKPVLVVPGNHDEIGYSLDGIKNTMLGMLASSGVVRLFTRQNPLQIDVAGNKVVFEAQEYFADIDCNPESYNKAIMGAKLNILFAHGMLQPNPILNTIKHVVISTIPNPADITFCGHDHAGWGCIEYGGKFFVNIGSIGRVDKSTSMQSHKPSVCILKIDINGPNIYNIPLQCVKQFDDVFDKNASIATTGTNDFINFVNLVSSVNLSSGNDPVSYINEMSDRSLINNITKDKSLEYINNSKLTVGNKNINHYTKLQNNIHITKLTMKDFMSHKNSNIEFVDGVNVISGENNTGKSTILRAIDWICYDNPKGSAMIRTGASSCEVKLEFSNGTYIRKTRNKTKASYYVFDGTNEVKYEGYGSKLPVEILNTHQMPLVNLFKDKDISINYADQLNGLFLVDCSPSEKSEAIGKLTGADIIDNAISASSSDMTKTKKEHKAKTIGLQQLDDNILEKTLQVSKLESIVNNVNSIMHVINICSDISNIVDDIKLSYSESNKTVLRYDYLNNNSIKMQSVYDELTSWNIDKYNDCLDILDNLNVTKNNVVRDLQNYNNILNIIIKEPKIEEINIDVINILGELQQVLYTKECDVNILNNKNKINIDTLDTDTDDFVNVLDLIGNINTCMYDISLLESNSTIIDNKIDNYNNVQIPKVDIELSKIEKELHKNGICEMCNRPLDEESVKYILNKKGM